MGYLIPNDWDGVSWCANVICWPDSPQWDTVLRGLVTGPTRGRFWDRESGVITDAQVVGREILARNYLSEGCMGCLEDLSIAINDLVQATYNASGCGCGGSGGAGQTPEEFSEFTDNGATYPDGWDDRDAYSSAKCDLALYTINRMLADFDRLLTVNASQLTAAALAATLPLLLLTPLSFVALFGVAVAILALYVVGAQTFVTAVTELKARIQAMDICLLYEAQTAAQAVSSVETWISDGTYTTQSLTVALGHALIGSDAINPLFSSPGAVIDYGQLPAGDCSECDEICEPFYVEVGTIVSSGAGTLTVQSVVEGSLHAVRVYWDVYETTPGNYAYCGDGIELTNVTSTNNLMAGDVYEHGTNDLLDGFHLYPPNGNLPVFPYSPVGQVDCNFNTGQSGNVTFTWTV